MTASTNKFLNKPRRNKIKISQNDSSFKPITITLENQNEVNWLAEVSSHIGGTGEGRKFFDQIYYALEKYSDNEENSFNGSVCTI